MRDIRIAHTNIKHRISLSSVQENLMSYVVHVLKVLIHELNFSDTMTAIVRSKQNTYCFLAART